MKYIKITIIALLLFVVSFLVSSFLSMKSYPNGEFQRVIKGTAKEVGGDWKFLHRKEIVDADFKRIVKPAVDFLYSSAVLNGKKGAHVISIPPIDRYFVFQFMEDDTDVFNYISSRKHGQNKQLDILLTPPNYKGETHGLETLELKTNDVWLLARFQLFNKEDAPNVYAIQEQVKFTPIEEWGK